MKNLETGSKKKKNKLPIILLAILILFVVLGVGVMAFLHSKLNKINKVDDSEVEMIPREEETFEMVVQVNGKVRGKIIASTDTSKEEMEKLAFEIDNVKVFVEGKEVVKVITVPKKLVNIVVK